MTTIKKHTRDNNISAEIAKLIEIFNTKIQNFPNSKDNHRSIFIDFYLKNSNQNHRKP